MTAIEDMDIAFIGILGSHVRKSVEGKDLLNSQPHGNCMTRCHRRSGSDRRSFSYDRVIPERRRPRDRRRQKERRNIENSNDRFNLEYGVYAALRTNTVKVGRILDISISGLAFVYIDDNEISSGHGELDIYVAGDAFYLQCLTCRIISDIEQVNGNVFSSVHMRRLSVKFERLLPHQISKLEYLIRNYTDTR